MLFGMNLTTRRNRLFLLAAAAAAAAIAVVVVVVVVATTGSKTNTTTTTAQPAGSGSTLAGVPQHGDTLGRLSAPTTLMVFEDPQCPYCRQWNLDTLPTVVSKFVRTGRMKVVYRGIEILGANSTDGLRAIYAAGRQNKLWNMVEALYERQGAENSGWITPALIKDAARSIGANPTQLVKDESSEEVKAGMNAAERERIAYAINGTPTFAIQKQLGAPQPFQVSSLEPAGIVPLLQAAVQ
jgi:protein-disulfide isomerase